MALWRYINFVLLLLLLWIANLYLLTVTNSIISLTESMNDDVQSCFLPLSHGNHCVWSYVQI